MKVAIIGAGLAGLSCAIVLEKHGIIPTVYEKTGFIGSREQHVVANLQIADRPIKDIIKYVKDNFGIDITPVNSINKLTHYSPNKRTSIIGNFGYLFRQGKEENSVKGQLYPQLKKTEVKFNITADYKRLSKEFDYVVAADGKPNIAEELGCWTDWIRGYIKGAVIKGNFNPNELIMWLKQTYCKNGYAYLTPFDSRKASLSLFVPDVSEQEVDYYWDSFIRLEQFESEIVETFKVKHGSGYVYPHKVNNIYLAGNTGGAIDPFLGFGQINAIIMGRLAAKSIAKGLNYEKLLRELFEKFIRMYELRKSFDNATNKSYDKIVTLIGFPGVKPIIYDTPINVVKYGVLAMRLKRKIKKRIRILSP